MIGECVEGASVVELCNKGDKLVEDGVASLYNKVKGTPKGKHEHSSPSSPTWWFDPWAHATGLGQPASQPASQPALPDVRGEAFSIVKS